MWILIILTASLFASGTIADPQENIQRCLEEANIGSLSQIVKLENPRLEHVCPAMLNFLECVDDAVRDVTGFRMADLARMFSYSETGKMARLFMNLRGILNDLCDNSTELYQAYNESAECMKDMNIDAEECGYTALAAFQEYKYFQNTVQEQGLRYRQNSNVKCMVQAYMSACLAAKIHDECGQSAFNVYQTIIKRSRIFRLVLCSYEDLEELKTRFLDSLNLEGNKKDLWRLSFDLKKRKK